LEFGASPCASSVLYDRSCTAINMVQLGEIDWHTILGESTHLHVSVISPALSISAAEATVEALKAAKNSNCTVSYDLNYRRNSGRLRMPGRSRNQ